MSDIDRDFRQLALSIKHWGQQLGFQQVGITDTDLSSAEKHLDQWLSKGYHANMEYMAKHGTKRSRPSELEPGTLRIISVRLDYLPESQSNATQVLQNPAKAFVSRYALGRDYHKLMRKRLQQLAKQISSEISNMDYRVFVDSAPVLEKPLAVKAGLGWVGKHSNLINRDAGSWFFLGEIYTNLPLPIDTPVTSHCGECVACIDVCPTQAIVKPYVVDGARCISYLTIENKGDIPVEFRQAIGNRIYGCDDCQLVCPWNRFAETTAETDFHARHKLDSSTLLTLFSWNEQQFLKHTEGSAIRRIGYQSWQRNIAVALGNAEYDQKILNHLTAKKKDASEMVKAHIIWAIEQQKKRFAVINPSNNSPKPMG